MSNDPIDDYLQELIGEATAEPPAGAPKNTDASAEETVEEHVPEAPLIDKSTHAENLSASTESAAADLQDKQTEAFVAVIEAMGATTSLDGADAHAPGSKAWADAVLDAIDIRSIEASTDEQTGIVCPPSCTETADTLQPADTIDVQDAMNTPAEASPAAEFASAPKPEISTTDLPPAINMVDELLAEMDSDPLFTPQTAPTASASAPVALLDELLAEMDSDPLFAGQNTATPTAPVNMLDELLAEMDNDPQFAQATSSADTPVVNLMDELLAEMDSDPLFAAGDAPAPSPAGSVMDDLLAELDSDPRFAAEAMPAAPHAASVDTPPDTLNQDALMQWIPAMATGPTGEDETARQRRASERVSRWLRLRCGEQPYALELLKVQEVGLLTPLLPLRGTEPYMLGIMNLRGQVVPVMDLGQYLGGQPAEVTPAARIVVLESDGQTLGLRVTAVDDVASLSDSQIEPPDTARLCRFSNHLFRGVARVGGPPMILLDANALLN